MVRNALGIAVGVALGAGLYFGIMKPAKIKLEFNKIYTQALFQYADTNKDGIISSAEQDEFDRKLLSGKGVTSLHGALMQGQMPLHKDGTIVSKEALVEWIKNYKLSE